jgi:hypothetical protein
MQSVKVNRRFRGKCRLHFPGLRISQARNQHEAGNKLLALQPWTWRRHVPLKRRLTCNGLHCVYVRGERTLRNHRCENLKFDVETFQVLLLLLIFSGFSPGKKLDVTMNGRENSHIQRIYCRCIFIVNLKVKLNWKRVSGHAR